MAIHPGVMCLMSVTNTPVMEEMEDCELPPNDSVLRACMKLDLPELKKCDKSAITPAHLRIVVMKKQTRADPLIRYMVKVLKPDAASDAFDVACGERKASLLISLGLYPERFTFWNSPLFRQDFKQLGRVNGSRCANNFSHPENIFCALGARMLAGAVPPATVRKWMNMMASSNDVPEGRSVEFLVEKFIGGPSTPADNGKKHMALCHNLFERRGLLVAMRRRFPQKNERQSRDFVDRVMGLVREHRWHGGPARYNFKYWRKFPTVFKRFATFLIRYSLYMKLLPPKIYVQRALAFDEQVEASRNALLLEGLGGDDVDAFCRSVHRMKDVWLHKRRLPRREIVNNVRGEALSARDGAPLTKRADYFSLQAPDEPYEPDEPDGPVKVFAIVQRLLRTPRGVCMLAMSFL